jgi:hypothetical protein
MSAFVFNEKYLTVFHRLEVDVIQVDSIIRLISDSLFPLASLPEPRSPRLSRTVERGSVFGSRFTNRVLMSCQRVGTSSSPGGNVERQCR